MADRTKGLKKGNEPKGKATAKTIEQTTTAKRENVKKSTRIKFTTALEKKIIDALKIEAVKRDKRPADIIELALSKELGL
jgi:hypothetical protein